MEIARRSCLEKLTAIELEARQLLLRVEEQGAHPLLTDAVSAVQTARERLADWIDAGKPGAAGGA